jgi:hypothetical protein
VDEQDGGTDAGSTKAHVMAVDGDVLDVGADRRRFDPEI